MEYTDKLVFGKNIIEEPQVNPGAVLMRLPRRGYVGFTVVRSLQGDERRRGGGQLKLGVRTHRRLGRRPTRIEVYCCKY